MQQYFLGPRADCSLPSPRSPSFQACDTSALPGQASTATIDTSDDACARGKTSVSCNYLSRRSLQGWKRCGSYACCSTTCNGFINNDAATNDSQHRLCLCYTIESHPGHGNTAGCHTGNDHTPLRVAVLCSAPHGPAQAYNLTRAPRCHRPTGLETPGSRLSS